MYLGTVMPLPSDPRALAMVVRDCGVDRSAFACHLGNILQALYVVAIVLAVVLVAVILLAVVLYRRKKGDRSTVL